MSTRVTLRRCDAALNSPLWEPQAALAVGQATLSRPVTLAGLLNGAVCMPGCEPMSFPRLLTGRLAVQAAEAAGKAEAMAASAAQLSRAAHTKAALAAAISASQAYNQARRPASSRAMPLLPQRHNPCCSARQPPLARLLMTAEHVLLPATPGCLLV